MTATQPAMTKFVRILCMLAVLMIGFAHKVPAFDYGSIPAGELAQYVLPDGSLPVLCVTSEDGTAKHGNHDRGSGCEACRLGASIVLPAPADTEGMHLPQEIERFMPLRSEAGYRQLFPPNASPRGPPSGLFS